VLINLLGIIVFREKLQASLNFDSFWPFVSLALIYVFSVSFTFRRAILQGRHDFSAVSISGIIGAAGKLVFAVILVALGWRAFGAITGLLLSQILATAYVYLKTIKEMRWAKGPDLPTLAPGRLKEELRYGFLILVANLTITGLYTSDVILAKYWFTPEEAGLYSGVSTIARIIFFLTGSIAGVMMPLVKLSAPESENIRVLLRSLRLTLMVSLPVLFLFCIFPEQVIGLMIGSAYEPYAWLLLPLSLLLFFVSLINLLFNYLMALRRFWLLPLSFSGLAAIGLCLYFFEHSLLNIIYSFMIGAGVILAYIALKLALPRLKAML
jgi:O-antigen/teichoic acid export membrane protein